MFPNYLNFYFNYKISGDTSDELHQNLLGENAFKLVEAFKDKINA